MSVANSVDPDQTALLSAFGHNSMIKLPFSNLRINTVFFLSKVLGFLQ